jgi:hypothetical protein
MVDLMFRLYVLLTEFKNIRPSAELYISVTILDALIILFILESFDDFRSCSMATVVSWKLRCGRGKDPLGEKLDGEVDALVCIDKGTWKRDDTEDPPKADTDIVDAVAESKRDKKLARAVGSAAVDGRGRETASSVIEDERENAGVSLAVAGRGSVVLDGVRNAIAVRAPGVNGGVPLSCTSETGLEAWRNQRQMK